MKSSRKDLSPDGVFDNGITAVAVIRFILDYEQEPRLDDVAARFGLQPDAVVAALERYAEHFEDMPPLVGGERA